MKFTFPYHRVKAPDGKPTNDWPGKIEPKVGGAVLLKIKSPDFTGEEDGHVMVRCLPPGSYQVDSFKFGGFLPGVAAYTWSPSRPFNLPFEIRTGQATYIGSFVRAPSLGSPLEKDLGAAGYFVVADRADRDLPIAAGRLPANMRVTKEVTDVTPFGMAALRSAHP